MDLDELIEEGRRIQRKTFLLLEVGGSECAAYWYGRRGGTKTKDGYRCWLSVNAQAIPSSGLDGWLSIFTNENTRKGGRVEITPDPISTDGVRLYQHEIKVLPPIDAVLSCGSNAIDRWLAEVNWKREWAYNSNFRDRATVEKYEKIQQQENPLYWGDAYATLGGWHNPWPDGDWNELIAATLLVHTYLDSEPWVETWRMPTGELEVVQRIT